MDKIKYFTLYFNKKFKEFKEINDEIRAICSQTVVINSPTYEVALEVILHFAFPGFLDDILVSKGIGVGVSNQSKGQATFVSK